MTTTRTATRTRTTATLAALAGTTLLLAGCGGASSKADGQYIYAGVDHQKRIVAIDDDTVTYERIECDGVRTEDVVSIGELSADGSTVVWTQEGHYSGADSITITDTTVSIDNSTFHHLDSDAGKAALEAYDQRCPAGSS